MLTTEKTAALIGGGNLKNKNDGDQMALEKKKFINANTLPYQIDGQPILPGETFVTENTVYIQQLIGAGTAIEVTKENEKELTAKYASLKEAWLASQKPKGKEK